MPSKSHRDDMLKGHPHPKYAETYDRLMEINQQMRNLRPLSLDKMDNFNSYRKLHEIQNELIDKLKSLDREEEKLEEDK